MSNTEHNIGLCSLWAGPQLLCDEPDPSISANRASVAFAFWMYLLAVSTLCVQTLTYENGYANSAVMPLLIISLLSILLRLDAA